MQKVFHYILPITLTIAVFGIIIAVNVISKL